MALPTSSEVPGCRGWPFTTTGQRLAHNALPESTKPARNSRRATSALPESTRAARARQVAAPYVYHSPPPNYVNRGIGARSRAVGVACFLCFPRMSSRCVCCCGSRALRVLWNVCSAPPHVHSVARVTTAPRVLPAAPSAPLASTVAPPPCPAARPTATLAATVARARRLRRARTSALPVTTAPLAPVRTRTSAKRDGMVVNHKVRANYSSWLRGVASSVCVCSGVSPPRPPHVLDGWYVCFVCVLWT